MMVRQGISRMFHFFNLLLDVAAATGGLLAAYALRFSGWPIPVFHDIPGLKIYLQALPVILLVILVVYHYAGLYLQRRGISGVDEFSRIVKATTIAFLILIVLTFFSLRVAYSRVVFLYAWVITIALTAVCRTLLRRIQVVLRRRGIGLSRLAIVGLTQAARRVAEQVQRYPGLGYRLVGMVAEARKPEKRFANIRVLGHIKQLPQLIEKERIDEVIFALPASAYPEMDDVLLPLEALGVEFKIVSDLFGIITNPMSVDDIYGIPVFALKSSPLSGRWARVQKRTLDLIVSILLLLLISPLLALIAVLIKLTSPGPVFYRQERVGRGNQPFMIFKFRSMRQDAEKETGPVWAKKGDSRATPLGSFLRKSSLDELPQLFNVFKGEMSMVGPRPERPHFVNQFKASIPRYLERHKVKAGLTGWAAVHGMRGNTPIEERVKYDLWYVENWSLILDIKILIRTGLDVFHHRDAY